APLIDWTDPQRPRLVGELRTLASVAAVSTPPPEQMHALFDTRVQATPARPTGQLSPSADAAEGPEVGHAGGNDGSAWRDWTRDGRPVLDDDAFLLQGKHHVTVRSRKLGDCRSEDSQPPTLEVIIDSVAPVLKPHLDDTDAGKLAFGGFDQVTDDDKLE